METQTASNRLHPLVAAAAASVILVSLTGVAAINGLLPTSHSSNAPAADSRAPAAPVAIATLAAPESKALPEPKVEEKPQHKVSNAAENKVEKKSAPAKPASAARPASANQVPAQAQYNAPAAAAPRVCHSCGRIEAIQAQQQPAQASGVGMVAGAVLGGVFGNQVGGGNGRKLATVAGAVGGGYAGNEIEKHARSTTTYHARVRMEDGSTRNIALPAQDGWQVGDRVKIVNGKLTAQG